MIPNKAGQTIFRDAEHAIFGFPEQNPNNPVNTMILFLYSYKFAEITPNVNTLLRQIKEVCKIQLIKRKELNNEFPGWKRL